MTSKELQREMEDTSLSDCDREAMVQSCQEYLRQMVENVKKRGEKNNGL